MDLQVSSSGNGEDNNSGLPDDLRCKRSDGKQWRCTALSMPDKTVCEKHYVQAKKRAANSALRANLKKFKRTSLDGDDDGYLESNNDDTDTPNLNMQGEDYHGMFSRKKHEGSKSEFHFSPESTSMRGLSTHSPLMDTNDQDFSRLEETGRTYKTPPSAMEACSQRSEEMDDEEMTEFSDGSTDSSDDSSGQICHQCRRIGKHGVIWCESCDKRGYCARCIAKWYSDMPLEEILRICPACRGTCKCKVCLRGDSLIKVRIREIPIQNKLQYFYRLLSSVLPVVKQIHYEQSSEAEIEKKLCGSGVDLARTKLNVDEQMCCNLCRIPIVDYHRHCANCSYDLCLRCCKDLRKASENGGIKKSICDSSEDKETMSEEVKPSRSINLFSKFPGWEASSDGSIPCPANEYGGCGCSSLTLSRIFKMNWVAKLVKNTEEMVRGCKVYEKSSPQKTRLSDSTLYQAAEREDSDDNFMYCPSSEDVKREGIGNFRKYWLSGEPVIVKQVCDRSSCTSWDPMLIRREIRETSDEGMKDEIRVVKAIDCLDWSEVDIDLSQFIKGYSEGRTHECGWPQMLKLKDWPTPSASEQFLIYHNPEIVSKLPLLEYIHSKWDILNVAAKVPHYSLQNEVGPKIIISYGTHEELGRGDSVTNVHFNMSDTVYLLVHTSDLKGRGGLQEQEDGKIHKVLNDWQADKSPKYPLQNLTEMSLPNISLGEPNTQNEYEKIVSSNTDQIMEDQRLETTFNTEEKISKGELSEINCGNISETTRAGVIWDVFRRQDAPKLVEYMRVHWKEFGKPDSAVNDPSPHPLHDQVVFLNRHHKRKFKEEFGLEPWSFEQHLGQAVFIPAGCPFQSRNLQSTVQLGLDFLSSESLGEAVKLSEEIRCLPNDHEAKPRMLEVEKMSLYAASAAIKEVQKLVLDPKLRLEIGFEDPNLTAMVSENLEKVNKRRHITCP